MPIEPSLEDDGDVIKWLTTAKDAHYIISDSNFEETAD